MLHTAAEAIRSGGSEIAIVCGGESLASVKRYKAKGASPDWSHAARPGSEQNFDRRRLPAEVAAGMAEGVGVVYGFAIRDIARRAHLGIEPAVYRREMGEIASGMTQVASANPHAWFRDSRTADFLIEARPDNRMISYPYAKHMVAIIDVDIAGALILMSSAEADRREVAQERRVYPWNGCFSEDRGYAIMQPHLWRSEAMNAASRAVLDAAGLTMDEVSHVDLYSCFPAAINFARDALDIHDRSGERLTVTGGLPYGGGPASSYMITSLVKMTERLRADPGSVGLVSGLGKSQMIHHAFGLYSTRPPQEQGVQPVDERVIQGELDKVRLVDLVDQHQGAATIAGYTIVYDSLGEISHGVAVCDLPGGERCYARLVERDLLREGEARELVGNVVRLSPDEGLSNAYAL
jgi:acetyl-CoA C-acetyltransferase